MRLPFAPLSPCLAALASALVLFGATAPLAALERGMFGWRGGEVAGRRPLLVIWLREADDMPADELAKYKQYYHDVVFGQSDGAPPAERRNHFELSVVGYYHEVSAGKFTFTRAGLVGPLGAPVKGRSVGEIAALALKAAAREGGIDFKAFDANRDGRIAPDELAVLIFTNVPLAGRRWEDFSLADRSLSIPDLGVAFAGRVAVVGETDAFAIVNRELFHLIAPAAVNLDGWPQKCFALNGGRSLMAAANTGDPALTMHLDPWHKMLVGWTEPRVFALGKPNREKLAAQHIEPGADMGYKRPILLYEAMKGTSEFFLLEYRTHSGLGFDQAVVNSGVVVWQVALDAANRPFEMPADRKNCKGETLRIPSLFVRGAPNWLMGGNTAYWGGDGPFSLKWMDGSDSGVRVTLERHEPFEWRIELAWSGSAAPSGN
jgi:M6 family metalloprotease-like protein